MIRILAPRVRLSLSLISAPVQLPVRPLPSPPFPLTATYEREPSLGDQLPIEVVRTSFLTESTFALAHFGEGCTGSSGRHTSLPETCSSGSPSADSGIQDFRPFESMIRRVSRVRSGTTGISLRYSLARDSGTRKPGPDIAVYVVGRRMVCGCPL